jgi:hypothetical protein
MLVTLPCSFNENQVDGRAERNESGVALTYRERFCDVLEAIMEAAMIGSPIADPGAREKIAEAAQHGVTAIPVDTGVVRAVSPISPTVQEAVETAVNGVKAALDAEEAANDPREPDGFPAPTGDSSRDLERIGKHMDEKGPQWNDFVQTDGENVGEPKYKRRPRVGDLRITSVKDAQAPNGRYFIEQAFQVAGALEGDVDWAAPNLPFPLLRTFDSRDQLIEEVAKAGHESQLVNA